MTTQKDVVQKTIVIRFDDPLDTGKWTSVQVEKVRHVFEDDGSDDLGYIPKTKIWNKDTIADAASSLPAAIYNYLTK